MRKAHLAAIAAHKLGAHRLLDRYWGPDRLTVLCYHRILDASGPDFPYYQPNVSATPELFARQMAYVAGRFNVIDLDALRAFLAEGRPLPPRPLLITFDDGYLDNYTHAYPVLKAHGFPAVIFLLTSRMDDPGPAWWDECAHAFFHTHQDRAALPLLGERDLSTPEQRRATREALLRALKQVPETRKLEALRELHEALAVEPPSDDPPLFMSWDQVRELVANGIACQPHTVTHPILTRVDHDEMRRQIVESRDHIEAETGQKAVAFAYPNGTPGDYDAATLQALRESGCTMAFTLSPGPMRARDAQQHPLEIPRVYLGRRDTFEMFVLKTMGAPALVQRPQFVSPS